MISLTRDMPVIERRLLQLVVFLAASVAVFAGVMGVIRGSEFLALEGARTADSHVRYFSGLLLGVGLGFWSTIPNIQCEGSRLRILSFVVVCGGLGRLWATAAVGPPHLSAWLALINETLVPLILCLWQIRVARRAK